MVRTISRRPPGHELHPAPVNWENVPDTFVRVGEQPPEAAAGGGAPGRRGTEDRLRGKTLAPQRKRDAGLVRDGKPQIRK